MRRVGLRRCAARGGNRASDVDSGELRRADEELDAVRSPEGGRSDDPVLRMLGALAADVDTDADAEKPIRKHAPAKRRLISRAAVATSLTAVALSGTGVAAAAVVIGDAGPLRSIHYAVQALYDRDGASTSTADVQAAIGEARSALAAGRLDDAGRALHRARAGWANMEDPRDARVAKAIHGVEVQLGRARQGAGPEGSTLAKRSSHGAGEEQLRASAPEASTAGEPTSTAEDGSAPASRDGDQPVQPAEAGSSPSPSPSEERDGKCEADDSGESGGARTQDGRESDGDCRADDGGGQADDSGQPGDGTQSGGAQSGGGQSDDSAQSGGGQSDDSAQPGGGTGGGHTGGSTLPAEEAGAASPSATP